MVIRRMKSWMERMMLKRNRRMKSWMERMTLKKRIQRMTKRMKKIWFCHSMPKFSFTAWLAIHDHLATGDRMASWNIGVNPVCVFCQVHQETRDHLFFACRFSQEMWCALRKGLLTHADVHFELANHRLFYLRPSAAANHSVSA